jgi:CRISPR-associated protein Csd1
MIFQALNDLYDRLRNDPSYGVAPAGRSLQKISFKVVLRPDGSLLEIADAREDVDGRLRPAQKEVLGSTKSPGSGLNPCFLWDNTQYMLGIKVDDSNPDRTRLAFEEFRRAHLGAENEIDVPAFRAVCRFLEGWDPDGNRDHPVLLEAGATGYGLFQLVGETRYVHEIPEIQTWWDARPTEKNPVRAQCLVTGEIYSIARTHEKIKGVVGGQGAGGTIAGFNDAAYESYGFSQSYNAPVAESVAFRYVTALNALLDGPRKDRHRILLGDMTMAFWTEEPSPIEDFFAQFLTDGEAPAVNPAEAAQDEGLRTRLKALLEALRRGRADPSALGMDPERTHYHVLALSPNAGRISVRFHHRGTLDELLHQLSAHYHDLALVRRPPTGKWRGDPEFPVFRDLLDQTARVRRDVPPLLAAPLMKAAIQGTPYPAGLYHAVLRRIAADREVTYLRACVLKGFLNRNLNQGLPMALDTTRTDPPYRLGRLFAALEKTQQDALGHNLNKTIRDTYYGSASATPRSVFPRLLRTYQHHLGKVEGGFRIHRERLIQEILSPLTGFPAHLDLAGQGLFAIGYYHQKDAFYQKSDEPTAA